MHNVKPAGISKVGIITATFPFGSPETFLRNEIEALTELGCQLTIFPSVPRSTLNAHQDLNAEAVRFPVLGLRTLFYALRGLRRNVPSAFRALTMILKAKSDLKTKCRNLALFPTGLAVADEVCRRQLDHVHAYWLTGASTVAFIASHVAGVKWSYSAHSYDIFMTDNLIAEKTTSASFGRVISELGRREILRRSHPAAAGRLKVIRLGVDSSDRAPRGDRSARSIRLLCPAALIPVKGHVYLLEALRRVVDAGVDCHCVFAGEGRLRAALARKIRELGLENVVSMPGMIRHQVLLQQLRSGVHDAVVLASVERGTEFEGIPASLIEAMAAGIPCIATSTGAISELISDRCGVLVPEKDPAALSDAIIALASDPQRRKEIGMQAKRRVAEEFDAGVAARSLIRLMAGEQSSPS